MTFDDKQRGMIASRFRRVSLYVRAFDHEGREVDGYHYDDISPIPKAFAWGSHQPLELRFSLTWDGPSIAVVRPVEPKEASDG